jgi:Ala-tRNA(Pro) deacylase
MPAKKLREFLDAEGIKYVTVTHSPAFTMSEIAATAHICGKQVAKTVMANIDGELAMAVVSSPRHVNFQVLKDMTGAHRVKLASEAEFARLFPECEVGGMPPFGNLYGMDVYVSSELTEYDEIVFNAGSHTELIKLAYADFERLVHPRVMEFSTIF